MGKIQVQMIMFDKGPPCVLRMSLIGRIDAMSVFQNGKNLQCNAHEDHESVYSMLLPHELCFTTKWWAPFLLSALQVKWQPNHAFLNFYLLPLYSASYIHTTIKINKYYIYWLIELVSWDNVFHLIFESAFYPSLVALYLRKRFSPHQFSPSEHPFLLLALRFE